MQKNELKKNLLSFRENYRKLFFMCCILPQIHRSVEITAAIELIYSRIRKKNLISVPNF